MIYEKRKERGMTAQQLRSKIRNLTAELERIVTRAVNYEEALRLYCQLLSAVKEEAIMETLQQALLNIIPGMEEKSWSGKGRAPEQIQAAEGKLDKSAYSLNHLIYETVQMLKRTEEEMTRADESVAHALEALK